MRPSLNVPVLATIDEVADPSRAALLVYDGLRHNLRGPSHAEPSILTAWPALIAAARKAHIPVIYTRHHPVSANSSPAWVRYRMRMGKVRDASMLPELAADSDAYEIDPALGPLPTDVVLDKDVNSAFHGTQLASLLRGMQRETLIVTGIATESGVETTARVALVEGFYCVVVADCVSSPSRQRHDASLAAMQRFADVITASTLLTIWGRSGYVPTTADVATESP